MAKRGVAKITGPKNPKLGEPASYSVTEWYPNTPKNQRTGAHVTWELFRKRDNGNYTSTNIKKKGPIGTFTFEEKAYGYEFFVEGYLNLPEKKGNTIVHIKPVKGTPKIVSLTLFDSNRKRITAKPKYGQTLVAEVKTQNLFKEKLFLQVWERDTTSNVGHDQTENTLLYEKQITVNSDGLNYENIVLTQLLMQKAQGSGISSMLEGGEHEYYLVVKHNNVSTHSVQTVQVLNATISVAGTGNNPVPENGNTATNVGQNPSTTGQEDCCIIDEEHFLKTYDEEFPTKDKKGNKIPLPNSVKTSLKRMFRSISEYYSNEKRCCNKYHIAYMLATAKHETGHSFDPIEEANWLSWNVRKKYFEEMYDPVLGKNETRKKMALENENTKQGDGEKYFGRGYVQLTWKKNYRRMQEKFGVNLVDKRENALNHELAVKIMIYGSEEGIFTGKKLSNYITETQKDYTNARRVINGTDKAATIAGYAEKIEKCLNIKKCNCGNNTTPEPASTPTGNIVSFDAGLTADRRNVVSQFTISLLEKAAKNSANDQLIITSTIRSTRKQAEVMYENENNGNHIRYAAPGREVVAVFNAGKNAGHNKEKIISDMDNKIKELSVAGKRVSLHCVSEEVYKKNNIIDISYTRGAKNPRDLIRELVKDPAVTKIIHPLDNVIQNDKIKYDAKEPAVHVETKVP
ncbi:hypothetical protein PFY12_12455 [Chryseobacterium camelliae]|uniref:Glycoside hydrolase family 19 catalytic domain-containing protein n=1 Tax=Chryseobacterium camelliae TaxID=1265445 RepID=A0ABY7QJI2_9FLAO|nr:hypothetical protein [Chryseobacterium camelliae]WBV59851.1 hypothetical protein PFY12_12455 [Chryseobacterium camelliae]